MPNQHDSVWSRNTHEKLSKLFQLRDEQYNFDEIAQIMRETYKEPFTGGNCSAKYYRELPNKDTLMNDTYEKPFKESIEHKENGVIEHDKLVQLTEEDAKNPQRVMELCGYDPNEWEVINCQVGFWTYRDKETPDGKVSRTCKLKVKPRENNDFNKLIAVIENQKPFNIKLDYKDITEHYLLEIAPVDTHFGISSYEYYTPNQQRIINKIKSRYWSEVVIPVGNDLFHNDDFRGRTSSGREIQKVDMDKAWEDAEKFYYPIIDESIEQANNVNIVFVRGNHDESMSWAFVKNLKTKYPNLTFDDKFQEHKAHIWKDVFIGLTHGEKNRKNTANIFNTKFREEIAKAKVREVHQAHLHGEDARDDFGIMVRTLSTSNQEDEWHDQQGYVGKNKRFQLFEYSADTLESIHYV